MYLLDTNTVIYFCNSNVPEDAKNLLFNIDPIISVITSIELFASPKLSEKEKFTLQAFVEMATVYDHIDVAIAGKAITIRQLYKTKLPDAIIAATALVYNLTLVTHNISDFRNIKGLLLIDPLNINQTF